MPYAPSHYRHLQSEFLEAGGSVNLDGNIKLSISARKDLMWWKVNLPTVNGKAFWLTEPELEIFSDASLRGWEHHVIR